jgi:hypothetical protein
MNITPAQLGRLQTLYAQFAAREIGMDAKDRDARVRWATERLRKPVSSFKNLTMEDAGFLIDGLQTALGVKAPLKTRLNRTAARRAGLDGRADGAEFDDNQQMATAADLARIQRVLEQLAWDDAGLRKFLDSPRSPLAKRASKQIRTTRDANKVYWALKRIAQAKGLWRKTA